MLNFGDLWFTVARRIKDFDDGGIVAKELVNRAAREIALKAYWPFLTDEKQFQLVEEYTTGHCDVTLNSFEITGTGTTFTPDFVGREFRLTGSDVVYPIRKFVSTTSLYLDFPYQGTTDLLQDYGIIKRAYQLERDTIGILNMRIPEATRNLYPGNRSKYYNISQDIEDAGDPEVFCDGGRTKIAYYDTGTVTVTNGSATVTGVGTTWTSAMVGKMFRIKGDRTLYRIFSVGAVTTITLEEVYQGQGASTASYEIDPPGIPLVLLYPRPDNDYTVYYTRVRAPKELRSDDEISDFPDEFQDVIIKCAEWLGLQIRGADLGLIDRAFMTFRESLKDRIAKTVASPNLVQQQKMWGADESFPRTVFSRTITDP